MSSIPWSQLISVAVASFICTFTGLYINHHLTSNASSQNDHHSTHNKHHKLSASKSKQKATHFWDAYHCDESLTTEWLADWADLKSFILSQITKIINQHKDTNPIRKSDLKILVVGNGLSEVPIHLYKEGYTNITITDVSAQAMHTMKQKHSVEQYPHLKWLVLDCTQMNSHFEDNSFDFVFEKGVSDTLQYRRPSKESDVLLQQMFSEITRLLNDEYGKYLCVSPRRKVPLLRLNKFNWSVKRMQLRKFDENKLEDAQDKVPPFVYVHICTKINSNNHKIIMKQQQNDRRKRFEKATDPMVELKRLDFKFEPLIEIKDIEKDIIVPFKHYEEGENESDASKDSIGMRLKGILKDIDAYYMIHGIIQYKRKFGKKLMFYQVSLMGDKTKLLQCIAERHFIAKLSDPKLKQEYATNNLTKCGDEVKIYGKLGITNRGILSLFVYYVSLIQYHCNWKYE